MALKLQAPVVIQAEIWITNGEDTAKLTISFPPGRYPTEQEMRDLVLNSCEKPEIPEGFRLLDKREFFDQLLAETTGTNQRFAMDGGPEWDA